MIQVEIIKSVIVYIPEEGTSVYQRSPENQKQVTVMEAINTRWDFILYIIIKDEQHIEKLTNFLLKTIKNGVRNSDFFP